jgi:hypothetical protein
MTSVRQWLKAAAHVAVGPRTYARLATTTSATGRGISRYAWRLGPSGRENRRRLESLRDRYRGRRCFILGGGPSLAKTDLTRLRDELTIGCNAIFLIFDRMGFLPTFYTVEDQLVAEDRAERINALHGTTRVFPRDLSYCLRPDRSTVYVNFRRSYNGFPKFSADLARVVYWGGTVTFLNLQLAYFLGCREVYLLGVDHSYRVPDNLKSTVIISRTPDENHFHPDYFGPGFRWHDPKVERMEEAYKCARDFASAHGMRILNATLGGSLEVFPRVEFASLFETEGSRL